MDFLNFAKIAKTGEIARAKNTYSR